MKKNTKTIGAIGPISILLDDRYAKQLEPLLDAVREASKTKKPRGIFGQIAFVSDLSDGLTIPCLTVVCPEHDVAVKFTKMAKDILGVKA